MFLYWIFAENQARERSPNMPGITALPGVNGYTLISRIDN
ncbi:hypothetical protein NIES2098_27800 [Calothrix sp. NIES-2098]|nr:hypothetical protein NIES2098_27800 [Calothrix sp. NIES-2098]